MPRYDRSYKLLFSDPSMVRDLLSDFVPDPFVQEVDFSTLERVSGSNVTDGLHERHNDMVWRVRWRGEWLYVYLLLEFQSKVDPWMALRMMVYVGLVYQDLIRTGRIKPGQLLSPMLPLVLYNGSAKWTAVRNVSELIRQAPIGLVDFRPSMRHLVVAENEYQDADLAALKNLVAALFRLENSRSPQVVQEVVESLVGWLSETPNLELNRAFATYIHEVSPSRKWGKPIPAVNDLQEMKSMLAERMKEWPTEWVKQGKREGRLEGQKQALSSILLMQLEQKFGALEPAVRQRVAKADANTLTTWASRVLQANSIEDVVG